MTTPTQPEEEMMVSREGFSDAPSKTSPAKPDVPTHFGDPCIHCGLAMEDFEVGACKGDFSKSKVIGYVLLERRWDGCQHYRWRTSDNAVHDAWSYPDAHAPYYHFGKSRDLIQPPPYDARLKASPFQAGTADPQGVVPGDNQNV